VIARSTVTVSGKTLSFLPSILETCIQNPQAIALLIFPLKALAIDQMSKLEVIRRMDTQVVKSFL
jgi:DEAD/DEAH box helicase domain-containing protein